MSEQEIQEMIGERIMKMEEIRMSLAELEVKQPLENATAVWQNL